MTQPCSRCDGTEPLWPHVARAGVSGWPSARSLALRSGGGGVAAAGACRRGGPDTHSESLWMTSKNVGTKNTDNTVDVSMPPKTAVPSDRRLAAPAPAATTRGTTPRMNANDD